MTQLLCSICIWLFHKLQSHPVLCVWRGSAIVLVGLCCCSSVEEDVCLSPSGITVKDMALLLVSFCNVTMVTVLLMLSLRYDLFAQVCFYCIHVFKPPSMGMFLQYHKCLKPASMHEYRVSNLLHNSRSGCRDKWNVSVVSSTTKMMCNPRFNQERCEHWPQSSVVQNGSLSLSITGLICKTWMFVCILAEFYTP